MTHIHLGDAKLVYIPGIDPVVDPSVVPGQLLGSGTGTIEGPHLRGEMHWSFFEEDCAWDPGVIDVEASTHGNPGRSACRTYPRGVIDTEDGARIQFEAQGFALRRKDEPTWKLASTVRFVTDHQRYQWLTGDLVTYEGTFNELTGTAIWSFHAPEEMISAGAT